MNNKRKVIRTCLHQPFEFNIRTLDNLKSIQLVNLVQSLSNQDNIKIGLGMRTCIRQLRSEQQILCVILIFDQSIKEMMIQFATVLWKYKFEPIVAKEESRTQFKNLFKTAKRINCIYLQCKQKIGEEEFQNLKIQFNLFKDESKFEIPLIFKQGKQQNNQNSELALKPTQLINHVVQVQNNPKQQQTQKKVKIQPNQPEEKNQSSQQGGQNEIKNIEMKKQQEPIQIDEDPIIQENPDVQNVNKQLD
ncbi:hypothetical protein pb186bvf_001386 [Paramecium bursaria]